MRRTMEGGQDKISELPDPILGHILSLMPICSATRTSILSSRWKDLWKYIWTSATTLDFTGEFASRQNPDQLVASVDRHLQLHRGKKIRCFRLSLRQAKQHQAHIEKWVEFAATKDVEELDLDFFPPGEEIDSYQINYEKDVVNLPNCVFTSGLSFTHFSLSFCNFPPSLDLSSFRLLKSLSLRAVNVEDGILQSVLSDCLLLETLSLRECPRLTSIEIASQGTRLRQLVLLDCWDVHNLQISVPSVESFHLLGEINMDFSFQGASSLADAFICSIGRESSEIEHDYLKLLSDLAHVSILTVCTATLMRVKICEEYYIDYEENLPLQLENLQELQLLMDVMDAEYLSSIYGFFRLCPSPFLEKLFIWLPEILEDPNRSTAQTEATEGSQNVSFEHLKAIKLSNFKGCRCEMELVKYLLGKATNLECLVLVAPPIPVSDEDHRKLVKWSIPESRIVGKMDLKALYVQLSSLPKASPRAQIVLFEYTEDDGRLKPVHGSLYFEEYLRYVVAQ